MYKYFPKDLPDKKWRTWKTKNRKAEGTLVKKNLNIQYMCKLYATTAFYFL